MPTGAVATGRGSPGRESLALARMDRRPRRSSPAEMAAWLARNAVDSLPEGALEAKLARAAGEGRPLRVKLGIDPTAPDIHLGHTVVLRKLREFQDLGHLVVLIIGDYTARVGDPSGRTATRPVLDARGDRRERARPTRSRRSRCSTASASRCAATASGSTWRWRSCSRLARTATVAQLLERDDFAKRYAAGEPISVLELLYPLMQGYDSVAVRADVELGGTDQKFNLLLGRDIQRAYGQPEQAILTMPILPGTDGEQQDVQVAGQLHRRHRAAGGDLRQDACALPDAAMAAWYELLLGRAGRPTDAGAARRQARAGPRLVVDALPRRGGRRGAEARLRPRATSSTRPPEEMPEVALPAGERRRPPAGLLGEAFGISSSEARRLIAQGGVRARRRAARRRTRWTSRPTRLDGAVLQVGKRRLARLRRSA